MEDIKFDPLDQVNVDLYYFCLRDFYPLESFKMMPMGLQKDCSLSSIGSSSIQNSPEIAVRTLNKIATIQQEQKSSAEEVMTKMKKTR